MVAIYKYIIYIKIFLPHFIPLYLIKSVTKDHTICS
jgi:hypothetical protein